MALKTLPFGELALLEDLITREQLHATLSYQAERRDASKPERKLGTLLVHQGYLTREEAREILRLQREKGPIEGYVLLERLGAGGMGTVFRAIQKSLEREVALKILTPHSSRHARYRARFLQEAKLLAELKHPNLVRAFEVGESQEHLYFAMEYVRGKTARELIARYGHIPEPEALDYMEQVTGAVAHYDEHRIIHRDIKPENILVTTEGQAKLADLGLSKRLDEDTHITRPGKTLGTPLYISPELARGDETIDIRSDLYSLGASFYHLVCGAPPFEGQASADLLTAHVREIPRSPRELNPLVSEECAALLLKLLEKRVDKRFQTPAELIAAIQRVRHGEAPEQPALGQKLRTRSSAEIPSARRVERETRSSGERPAARRGAARRGSSAERAAAPPGRRGGSGTFVSLGSQGSRKAYPGASSGRAPVIAAVVLALAAAVGVGLAMTNGLVGGGTQQAGRDPVSDLVALASRDPAAALEDARSYERAHASEPDVALARWDALAPAAAPGTPLAAELEAARQRLRAALCAQAAQALDELRLDVRDMVEMQGKVREALARIDAFPARFRDTPAWEQREELRREISSSAPAQGSSGGSQGPGGRP